MPGLVLPTVLEEQARGFRDALLKLAAEKDLDSAAVVMGVADALATVAATLDRHAGAQSLADRMHAFCARVEETYGRVRAAMETVPRA